MTGMEITKLRRDAEIKAIDSFSDIVFEYVAFSFSIIAAASFRDHPFVTGFGSSIDWDDVPTLLLVQGVPEIFVDMAILFYLLHAGIRLGTIRTTFCSQQTLAKLIICVGVIAMSLMGAINGNETVLHATPAPMTTTITTTTILLQRFADHDQYTRPSTTLTT